MHSHLHIVTAMSPRYEAVIRSSGHPLRRLGAVEDGDIACRRVVALDSSSRRNRAAASETQDEVTTDGPLPAPSSTFTSTFTSSTTTSPFSCVDAVVECVAYDHTEMPHGPELFFLGKLPPSAFSEGAAPSNATARRDSRRVESVSNSCDVHCLAGERGCHGGDRGNENGSRRTGSSGSGSGSFVLIKTHKTGTETIKSVLLDVAALRQ